MQVVHAHGDERLHALFLCPVHAQRNNIGSLLLQQAIIAFIQENVFIEVGFIGFIALLVFSQNAQRTLVLRFIVGQHRAGANHECCHRRFGNDIDVGMHIVNR